MSSAFDELIASDVQNVFLGGDLATEAIFQSGEIQTTINVQFFEEPLDKMGTLYYHAWASFAEISNVKNNDKLHVNGIVYGIVDTSPDEYETGVNLFLQKA